MREVRHRGRLGGCAGGGTRDDGSSNGREVRQPPPWHLYGSVKSCVRSGFRLCSEHARLRLDGLQLPATLGIALAQQPGARERVGRGGG